jgi:hypothetical protein
MSRPGATGAGGFTLSVVFSRGGDRLILTQPSSRASFQQHHHRRVATKRCHSMWPSVFDGTAVVSRSAHRMVNEAWRAAMKLWHNRRALGAILLLLGAGSLQGCAYPNYGYAGYPAYGGYGYPAYGSYGYPGYADNGGGVVIGGGWNGGYYHGGDWDRGGYGDHHWGGDRTAAQAGGYRAERQESANRPAAQSGGFRAASPAVAHQEAARGEAHHGDDHAIR